MTSKVNESISVQLYIRLHFSRYKQTSAMQEKRHTSAIVSELMPCSKRFSSIGTVLVVLVAERDELSYWYKQIGVCINAYICHYTKIKYKTLAKNIWQFLPGQSLFRSPFLVRDPAAATHCQRLIVNHEFLCSSACQRQAC